jgi:Ca2+-dependent lipid-binding protein
MSKELGTLVVVVLKAKNLYDKHSFYKQDPFAQISLDGKTHRTEVDIKGGQHRTSSNSAPDQINKIRQLFS